MRPQERSLDLVPVHGFLGRPEFEALNHAAQALLFRMTLAADAQRMLPADDRQLYTLLFPAGKVRFEEFTVWLRSVLLSGLVATRTIKGTVYLQLGAKRRRRERALPAA